MSVQSETTAQLAQKLADHLRYRYHDLEPDEIETLGWLRRMLKRAHAVARRAQRDAADIDPAVTAMAQEQANRQIREALYATDWRGNFDGNGFHAQHYDDAGTVVVHAESLEAVVDLVSRVDVQAARQAA